MFKFLNSTFNIQFIIHVHNLSVQEAPMNHRELPDQEKIKAIYFSGNSDANRLIVG